MSPRQSDVPARPTKLAVWAVLLFTLVVRGTVVWFHLENLDGDPDGYRNYAQTLLDTGTFGYRPAPDQPPVASAFRPPLYPLMLAQLLWFSHETGLPSLLVIATAHVLLGVVTVAVVIDLGVRLQLGWAGLLAGGLTACDPILLNQSTLLMTETLAALLAAAAVYALSRTVQRGAVEEAVLAGVALALGALCRPTFWVMLGLSGLVLCAVLRGPRRKWAVACYTIAAGLVLAPWSIRNAVHFPRPLITTTHGGFTLYLGNNPSFYDYVRQGDRASPWQGAGTLPTPPPDRIASPRDEWQRDRGYYRQAYLVIRADPTGFMRASFVRVGRLWQLSPLQIDPKERRVGRWLRQAIGGWYALVYLLVVAGMVRLGSRVLAAPWAWGLLLCASFTLVHACYWSNMRMRAPLVPILSVLAAAAVAPRSCGNQAPKSSIIEEIRLLRGPGT